MLMHLYQGKHLVPFSLKGVPAIDHFVQRNEDMQKLEDFFLGQTSQPIRRKVLVVHGLGGIGKTQLCIEFARKHQARYTAVLWMDGSSKDALQQSSVKVFPMLPAEEVSPGLVEAAKNQTASPEVIVKGVLDWLSLPSNQGWLHIIDNVDHDINTKDRDPSAYDPKKYSAPVDHGSLLITSRLSTLTAPQNAHQLTEMNSVEARALFEAHRGKPVSGQPTRDESTDLESLLGKLEGMPLALAQAGAFIRQTNISVREYLDSYNSTWDDLITEQDTYPLQEYAQRSMLTTWMISYQQVERQNREAATLLRLWAFLDPKDMWYELIACAIEIEPEHHEIDIPEWLSTLAKSRLRFRGALGLLKKYSLVNNGDNDNYSMHAVLHSWCRHLASMSSTSEAFLELAVNIISQMLPGQNEKGRGALWKRLFPHGQQLLYQLRLGTTQITPHVSRTIYVDLVTLFEWNRAFEEAAEILENALKKETKILGEDDLCTMDIALDLTGVYQNLNKHTEAQQVLEHNLAVCEKLLTAHPGRSAAISGRMIRILKNLGMIYKTQRRLEDAEGMLKRAIALSEHQQEKTHKVEQWALDAMLHLGDLHVDQARLTEAEMMYERTLEASLKLWGTDDTVTLDTLVALSNVYGKLGKVVEAKEVAERAAAGFDKIVLEDQHPRDHMAEVRIRLFRRQGKFAEAIVFARRVLKESEERLGPKHQDTLIVAFDLAYLYKKDNRLQEARSLYEQLIPKFEDTFGLCYKESLKVMENLALIYVENFDMLSEAEELLKRVLTVREEWLGLIHIETLRSVSDLGWLYGKQGDQVREVRMCKRAHSGYKDTLGTEHTRTLAAARHLRQALRNTSFDTSLSSRNMMLDGDYNLVASCKCLDGSRLRSSISLNELLANQGGRFAWVTRGNFVATARSIRLDNRGTYLAAELVDQHGVWKDTRVDLEQRITIHEGKLTFVALDKAWDLLWDKELNEDSGEESVEESGEGNDEISNLCQLFAVMRLE